MNKVILIGNLTRNPEYNTTAGGTAVCRFSIAVSREFTNADGERETDFFNVTTWRGLAENCARYLIKGNKVCVFGSLRNNTAEKDGTRRTFTEIIANEVEFLTPRQREEEPVVATRTRPQMDEITDNTLPF